MGRRYAFFSTRLTWSQFGYEISAFWRQDELFNQMHGDESGSLGIFRGSVTCADPIATLPWDTCYIVGAGPSGAGSVPADAPGHQRPEWLRPPSQRVEKRRDAGSAGINEPGAGTRNWTGFRRTIDRSRAAGDPGTGYKGNPSCQAGSERVTLMRQSLWRNDRRAYGGVPVDGNGICRVLELRSPSRPTG
jgi:hypothetical protein